MSGVTVKDVQDRLYAIHQTIPTPSGAAHALHAVRYFPQNPTSAQFPLVFSLPEQATDDNAQSGIGLDRIARRYRIYLAVESWGGGVPTETGQAQAEIYIDAFRPVYKAARRLELAHVALDGVIDSILIQDTGIITWEPIQLATIQYVLTVTTINSYTPA